MGQMIEKLLHSHNHKEKEIITYEHNIQEL
jgi:hypothetical protein